VAAGRDRLVRGGAGPLVLRVLVPAQDVAAVIGGLSGTRALARALRAGALLTAAWVVATPAAHACQACFGAEDSPIIDGARAGARMLLGLTFCLEAALVGFFIYLTGPRHRAR